MTILLYLGEYRYYSTDIGNKVPIRRNMNLSKPLTSLIPSLESQVLTVLAGVDYEFTGAQVHRIINGYSQKGVRNALNSLSEEGIVLKKEAGASNLYRLNPDHLLTPAIKSIATIRDVFLQKLTSVISEWQIKPISAAVFGSAARSDMTNKSDIDLFIHRHDSISHSDETWRRQLTELSLKVDAWTGNYLQVFELSDKDIIKERTSRDGVLYSISREGILVFGKPDSLRNLRG